MKFVFTTHMSQFSKLHKVTVLVDSEEAGTLALSQEEWEHLRAILVAGNSWFVEGEATVEIQDSSSVHAYLEGA
jgi:hypothetical protein